MKKLRNFIFTKSLIWLYVKILILKFYCCPVQALTVQKNKLRLVKSLVHSLHSFHIVYLIIYVRKHRFGYIERIYISYLTPHISVHKNQYHILLLNRNEIKVRIHCSHDNSSVQPSCLRHFWKFLPSVTFEVEKFN